MEYRFDVFGMPVTIRAVDGGWGAFHTGSDGKHRPSGFIVPPDVDADGLAVYLADLFHEQAKPHRSEVRLLC